MLNILCVKIGDKYSSVYVNRLYKMCKKNITQPFKFFCYTEDPSNVDSNITIIPFVDHGLEITVHNKLFLFSEYVDSYLTDGDRLYLDLDMVIKDNIDHVVNNNVGELTLIRSSWRKEHRRGFPIWNHMFNSSCMTWRSPHTRPLWEHFIKDVEFYTMKYHWGMDCFLSYEKENAGVNIHFFPERIFYSFLYGIDYEEEKWSHETFGTSFTIIYPRSTDSIPIVLFNGNTKPHHYERFKQYYED